MGKRSNFERNPRDFYPTPKEAVPFLIEHLDYWSFCEPCAGDGTLVEHLREYSLYCTSALDIEPQDVWIRKWNALNLTLADIEGAESIITNPPWDRKILHPMIDHFRKLRPTWLLIDANWMFTKQAAPYLKYCDKIVTIGRVKWIPDSPHTGKDDCCWHLFLDKECETKFYNERI